MRRSFRLLPLLAVVVLLGLVLPRGVIKADPTEVYIDLRVHNDLTILHWADFIPPYGDAAVADGTWSSGTGYQTTFTAAHGGGTIDAQYLYVQIPDLGGALEASLENVTQLTVYTDGIGLSGYEDPGGGGHAPDFSAADGSGRGTTGHVWTTISNFGGARFWSSYAASSTQYTWITGIAWEYDCTEDCGGGTLTRPLTSDDEVADIPLYDLTRLAILPQAFTHEFNVYDVLGRGGPQTVHAWSNAPGAPVHAANAGTIADVKPLTTDDCGVGQYWPHLEGTEVTGADFYDFHSAANQPCIVELYDTSPIGDIEDVPWPDYSNEASVYKHRYWLDTTDVYVVTLQIADSQKIQYLVRNAPDYVLVGDDVESGCVLGETIPLTTIPSQATNFPAISAVSGAVAFVVSGPIGWAAGAAAVIAGLASVFIPGATPDSTAMGYTTLSLYDEADTIQELASQLTVEPTNDDHCAGTGQYANCLASNPTFTQAGKNWVASGNVEWNEPGVTLDPGESITSAINLSSTGDYTVTAFAQGENGAAGEIRIFLGSNTEKSPAPLEWTSVQLTTEPVGAPDAGAFWTLGVQNTGTARLQIASLCVTDGAPNLGPNSCYFNNQSFVDGVSGWDTTEGVEPVDEGLNVPDDGVISQNVHLLPLPGGPATYKLVIRGDWWYNGTFDYVSEAEAIASVKYEWPDGTGYQDMVPINITGNLAYGAGQLAYIAEIEVSAETDDLMNIKVQTTTAGDMGVLGIRITDACLSTINGGPFPGQGGDGAPPPIDVTCNYVSRPQTNDPAAWLNWHWAKSEQFFTCKLMVLLNKMYVLGQQSYTLAGWQARYAQSTLKMWSAWLGGQFFPWFSGHLRNIAIGQVTTVYETGGTCSDIFCVLNTLISGILTPINNIVNTVLGLITTAANLFLTVLTGIIGVGLAFLTRIFEVFNQAVQLLAGIATAYNTATPVTIEGMPTCSVDPDSSMLCRVIWILDNTMLGGRWGVLFVLILSILSIHLIIWAIAEFRGAIIRVGSAT